MDYILKSNHYQEDYSTQLKLNHQFKSEVITIYLQHHINDEIKSLGIDLGIEELHSLIGTLLHIQAKIKNDKKL